MGFVVLLYLICRMMIMALVFGLAVFVILFYLAFQLICALGRAMIGPDPTYPPRQPPSPMGTMPDPHPRRPRNPRLFNSDRR